MGYKVHIKSWRIDRDYYIHPNEYLNDRLTNCNSCSKFYCHCEETYAIKLRYHVFITFKDGIKENRWFSTWTKNLLLLSAYVISYYDYDTVASLHINAPINI